MGSRIAAPLKGIALVAGGAVVAVAGLGAVNGWDFNSLSPFQPQQTDRSHTTLLTSVRNISEYHAAVGNFEKVLNLEDDNVEWLPDFIEGRRTVFIAAGTVSAYVDLSGLSEGDLTLSEDGKSVTVRLPEAQLGEPNLDHDRSYLVDQDRGVFDRIADAMETPEQTQFYSRAETDMAAAADESDLRERATENTKAMLTGMFGSLGIEATFLDGASG